jgi:VWFA-related protein
MSVRIRIAALFVALAGSGALAGQTSQPQSQAPGPTFKAQVEYVEVDAVVTDKDGNFVGNLEKEDFQVSEDGKPQTLSAFAVVNIPVEPEDRTLAAARPIESDVQSNERPFDGRVYVMLLDDLHVDASNTARVKLAARQFIERYLGANDLMAITFTGGRVDRAQEFTSNRRLLLNAVDTFMGQQLPPSTLTKNEEYHQQRDLPRVKGATQPFLEDIIERDRVNNAQAMLSTLQQVAAWLGGVHGRRKALLLFSEGVGYDLSDVIRGPRDQPSAANAIQNGIGDTLTATARSNVSVYTIDAHGISNAGGEATVSGFADQDDPSTGLGLSSLSHEQQASQESLRELAEESGGLAAVNGTDAGRFFDRIVRDNSSYYALAYYPPSITADGKFHRIAVTVNRRGLTVRSRRGYETPRAAPNAAPAKTGGMPPDLHDALNSPLPISGLTMRLFAAPFKGPKQNASVMIGIELSGHDLSLGSDNKVDVSFMAVDGHSKVFGAHDQSLALNMPYENRIKVAESAVRVLDRIELPPGRYRLHSAARDAQKKLVGSVLSDLEVPDFNKMSMGLSGVTVTSLAGAAMMTAILDDQLTAALPAPFIALRTFRQDDELDFFAEVYDHSGKAPHKIDIVTTLATDEGQRLSTYSDEHSSSELKGAKRAIRYTAHLPLSKLAPGWYVLTVEARSRLGTNVSATRRVPFHVVSAPGGTRR